MIKKKRITGILLSAAMLLSSAPPGLAVSAKAADSGLKTEIPENYVTAASTYFSKQLNPQAQAIYNLLVKKFEEHAMDDGVTDIDLNEAEGVEPSDVEAYLKGNRTLFNDFTAAKDAFDIEHPEAWYIDCDYLSFRTGDVGGVKHAYVGIGRGDTYLVQGMSAEEVDVDGKVQMVNEKIQDIANAALNVELPNHEEVTIKDQIEKAHDEIVKSITYSFEDGIRYKRVYDDADNFVEGVDYHDDAEAKHYIRTPFALISHAGVCESYSRAFQMVMQKMGVPCVLLHGVQTSGTPENHMWTAVQLPKPEAAAAQAAGMQLTAVEDPTADPDYAWYVCDLTWDDPTTYEWRWDPWTHTKEGYLPKDIVNGNDGGENNTYFLVGNDIVGGAWELSPYFSTKDMAFSYPEIAPASYTSKMLVDNPNGLSVKYAETAQMDDIKASLWEVRYKGMSCLQAAEKGYYFLCRLYSKHADGTMSQFDDWYYPVHGLYMSGSNPYELEISGNVHFHDTTAWDEAEETKKYDKEKGEGALIMTFGHVDYIEFAITTKAPPKWETPVDLLTMGGYYGGDGSDILAETGMMYNKRGSYEAAPAVTKQVPTQTASVKMQGGQTRHVSVEFNDRLYDPDASDETRKQPPQGSVPGLDGNYYDQSSNYAEALTQDLEIVPFYQDSFGRPHEISQIPTYANFKVTYACGKTETLNLDTEKSKNIDQQGKMNNGKNTPKYVFQNLTHEMNHTVTKWDRYENCPCGVVKVEFDLTNSPMWFDDGKDYMFSLKGLIGRQSDKLPATWGWTFVTPYCPICYRSQGIDMNLWAQPKLMDDVEDINMEKMVVQGVDGEEESLKDLTDKLGGSATFRDGRMALVVEDMTQSAAQGDLNEELDDKTQVKNADVLSRLVYDLNFARICSKIVVSPGQKVRLQVGFPAGFDASSISKGIKFAAYHFTRCSAEGEANPKEVYGDENQTCKNKNNPGHKWGDDVLSVEPIQVEVTPYGLVLIVERFSPFEIIAVSKNSPTGAALEAAELAANEKTLIVQREGEGDVKVGDQPATGGENGIRKIAENGSETYTITPKEGYQIGSINLSGKEIYGNSSAAAAEVDEAPQATVGRNADGSADVTVPYEAVEDANPMLLVKFEAKAVETQNEKISLTQELPQTCVHTQTKYIRYTDLSNPSQTEDVQDGTVKEGAKAEEPATCTAAGQTYGTQCTVCGQILTQPVVIPATGHNFKQTDEGTPATCTTNGTTPHVQCQNSGCSVTAGGETIPAKNHTYGEYTKVEGSATCKGTEYEAECIRCQAKTKKTKTEETVPHQYEKYTRTGSDKAPTCTEDGTVTGTCKWCDATDTKTDVGSATGHKLENGNWNVDPATGKCNVCGVNVCEGGHQNEVAMEQKQATCTDTGLEGGQECTVCGTITEVQKVTPKVAHTWDSETDEGHAGEHHCSTCKQWYKLPKGDGTHTKVMDANVDATCTKTGLAGGSHCSVCGAIIDIAQETPALGHELDIANPTWDWNETDGISATVTFTCKRDKCGQTHVYTVPKESITQEDITPADCTTPGKAKYVAVVKVDLPDDLQGEIQFKGTNESKELTVPALGHDYQNYKDKDDPTCSKPGTEEATCERCHVATDVREDADRPATGQHNFVNGVITKEATCTTAGVRTYTCANGCGTEYQEEIPASGHDFSHGLTCLKCGQPSDEAGNMTAFSVKDVDELVRVLTSRTLDAGDTIYLANNVYDLKAYADSISSPEPADESATPAPDASEPPIDVSKVLDKNGVLHIAKGITITTQEKMPEPTAVPEASASPEAISLAEELSNTMPVIKGSIQIEASGVKLDGLGFDGPTLDKDGVKTCIYTKNEDIINDVTVTDCTYAPAAGEADKTAFMVIEGTKTATVTGNTISNADIVVKPGTNLTKTGPIDMTNNKFEGVNLQIEPGAMQPGSLIDLKDSNVTPDMIQGDPSAVTGLESVGDLNIEVTFEHDPNKPANEYDVYLKGYRTTKDETKSKVPAAILNLVAVDLDVKIANEKDSNGNDSTLAITGFKPVDNWSYECYDGSRYLIHENGWVNNGAASNPKYDLNSETEGKIHLGTFTIGGYGTGKIKATIPTTAKTNVQQRSAANNIVESSIAQGKLGEDDTVVGDDVTIEATKRNLNVTIEFNNPIKKDVRVDYDHMFVTVTGANNYKKIGIVGKSLSGMPEEAYDDADYYGEVMDSSEGSGATKATLKFEGLTAPGRYEIEVTGPGYMPFRKSILIEEKSGIDVNVNIWNNVKDTAIPVVEGDKDTYNYTFLAGDIEQDNQINLYDLSAAVAYFGKKDLLTPHTVTQTGDGESTTTTTHWDPNEEEVTNYADYIKYDLNRDGKIDSKDIAMVLVSWDAGKKD